ncbi:amidohydrolase family protein [Roseomonas sp. BN140053]|uniref:amidohydrolase family protein n=1 Tax=Roseomonas sp. BN140053 TaxID=3391898 RepID=UPI0039E8A686
MSSASPSAALPPDAPLCAAPHPAPRQPGLALPPGACDCHAHICGPLAGFPYAAERIYTPPDALLPTYRALLARLGVSRGVLVQPSVYGTDNRVLLRALAEAGDAFRGVAVVEPDIPAAELEAMHRAGVRGVRVNLVDRREGRNAVPPELLRALAARIAPLGWHLELLLQVDAVPELDTLLGDLPVPLVFGHLGYVPAARGGAATAGFAALLRLLARSRCWVKLTGPYRISAEILPYRDILPMARALADAAPERLLWGSDWPHVMVKGAMPDDGDLVDLLADWLPSAEVRERVLVTNPAALYGFPDGAGA